MPRYRSSGIFVSKVESAQFGDPLAWFLHIYFFVLVVCFGFFGSFLVCVVFDGIAHWTLYWSTTSSFEAADSIDGLASNYNSACLLRLNVCNDLAKAMKELDGKRFLHIYVFFLECGRCRTGARS